MTITDQLEAALLGALTDLGVDPLPDSIQLERPGRREHGDWSSNVALASAKRAGRNPRELATEVIAQLADRTLPHVRDIELAGPGFVNFHLHPTWLHDVLRQVVDLGTDHFGRHQLGTGVRVNVEFVSANPTGPLHAGHARGACYGDTVARLLEAVGHSVEREFYINDRGVQMLAYAASLTARKRGEMPPEGGYVGQYVIDWAAEMPDDADPLEWGYAKAKSDQAETLAALGIVFDTWFSERAMVDNGAIGQSLDDLRSHGVVYEQDNATWLRSTDYGDDKDRVLVRGDGEFTYLAPDIAYHRDKFARADLLVNIWGADHHGYIARMKAAMQALGHDPDRLTIAVTQMVRLMKGDVEVKLSKRTGDIIELRELIDEIGADATRFTYLMQSVETPQTFDLELAAARNMDNPVFYVQMAHARLRSIQAKVAEAGIATLPLADVDLTPLVHERELEVLRCLDELPEIVLIAAREYAPHKIVNWLREDAAAVHGFYHDCYVMGDGVSTELTQARLWLVEAARIGLASALGLLGVSAPDSM